VADDDPDSQAAKLEMFAKYFSGESGATE